jgi:IclR family acetate operon transcriptional repressor
MKLGRTTPGKYNVEAVEKALDVLEAFSGSEELALSEVCRRVGLRKSRTFRLLYTLVERGYLERGPDTSRYRLGAQLFERVSGVGRDLRQLALPYMRRLHERFNETVNLGVLRGDEVLYIDIIETSRPFRMMATIGCRMPAVSTAMGKSMIARRTEDAGSRQGRSSSPGGSVGEDPALAREIARVRKRGYAMDDEENEPGVVCIGAAVLDASGQVAAAISVSGPSYRIKAEKKDLAPEIMAVCRGLSQTLGYREAGKMPSTARATGSRR